MFFTDWFTVIFGAFSAVIPSRTFSYFWILWSFRDYYKSDEYHTAKLGHPALIEAFAYNLLYGLWDIAAFPCGLLATIAPSRMITMIYMWGKYIGQCFATMPCSWDDEKIRAASLAFVGEDDKNRGLFKYIIYFVSLFLFFPLS